MRFHIILLSALLFTCGAFGEDARIPEVDALLRSSRMPGERWYPRIADELVSKHGREVTAKAIVAHVRDDTPMTDEISAARQLGTRIEPEFRKAVFQALKTAEDAPTVGRLLRLMRFQNSVKPDWLARWLKDKRTVEEMSKEARAAGIFPFRVCDIAFNVREEIRAKDKTRVALLLRTETPEERDARIAGGPAIKERQPAEATSNEVPAPAATAEVPRDHLGVPISAVELRARELTARELFSMEISKEKIAALAALMPELKKRGVFWSWASAGYPAQEGPMRDAIVAELRTLTPRPGGVVDREFRSAYSTAKALQDPEVARIALEHLPLVKVYRFPAEPPPEGWPSVENGGWERMAHGDQGIVASVVVELGDDETLAKFREMLKATEPETQRTLIWALGRSMEMEDFELLMKLRGTLSTPEAEDTLVRALNRIPQQMEAAVECPWGYPVYRVKEIAQLRKNAAECKARLAAKGLVVELSFYD